MLALLLILLLLLISPSPLLPVPLRRRRGRGGWLGRVVKMRPLPSLDGAVGDQPVHDAERDRDGARRSAAHCALENRLQSLHVHWRGSGACARRAALACLLRICSRGARMARQRRAADAAVSQQSGKIRTITCRMSGPCAPQQQGAPPGAERSPTSPLPDCAAARRTAAPRTRQPSRSTRARRGSTVRRGSGARTEPRGNVLAKLGLLARHLSAKRLQRFDHEGLQLRRHGHPPLLQHPAMPGPPTPVPLGTRARPDAAGFERLGAPAALPRPSLAARPRASHERARAARR